MSKKHSYHFIAAVLFVLFSCMYWDTVSLYGQPVKSSQVDWSVKPKTVKQTITVGDAKSDIPGYSSAAIQMAVDTLKMRGGGLVKLSPGTYEIMGPIHLTSGISLIGAGETTILHKVDGYRSRFVEDIGYGMTELTVQDASGFRLGMGVMFFDDDQCHRRDCWSVSTAKIIAVEGNKLYFDKRLVRDYRSDLQATVSNNCSIVEATGQDIHIANLVVDGNKETNTDFINGCAGSGICLSYTQRCIVEGIKVKNFNGDGIVWVYGEDTTVRNCEVYDCAGIGLHAGHSSGKILENCIAHHNGSDGIYVCWRVQHGTFTNNTAYKNGRNGISIGHKDTDNIFENNHVYENAINGIYLRKAREQNGAHRNSFYNNVVENNGTKKGGYGFYVDAITHDIVIENNTIRDTGKGFQKGGVYIAENTSNIKVRKNRMAGHKQADIIDKSGMVIE